MNFRYTKEIIAKMNFALRMGNLDIDALEVNDIPRTTAENELKKMYVSLKVYMSRLAVATDMDFELDEDTAEALPTGASMQVPLFPEIK